MQITDCFRAMAVFQGTTGLPEDVFINTWHYRNDQIGSDLGQVAATIERVLDSFYFGDHGADAKISTYLSPAITGLHYRVYDLGQAIGYGTNARGETIVTEPRDVRTRESTLFETTDATSAIPLPEEVAVCLSMRTDVKGARGRGRVYLGPLTGNAVFNEGGRPLVINRFRDAIAAAADDMRTTAENVTWVVASPTRNEMSEVKGGWVDNAWDTQRSRGPKATYRTPWGLAAYAG